MARKILRPWFSWSLIPLIILVFKYWDRPWCQPKIQVNSHFPWPFRKCRCAQILKNSWILKKKERKWKEAGRKSVPNKRNVDMPFINFIFYLLVYRRLTAVTFMGNAFEKEDINIQRHIRMLFNVSTCLLSVDRKSFTLLYACSLQRPQRSYFI